jgi:5'-AMP-activated protein kinase, catalytic alpha subunit
MSCVNTETNNEPLCIKVYDKEKIMERDLIDQVNQEILFMKLIYHPNVVAFKEVFVTTGEICIVVEFVGGGTLLNKIATEGKLSEEKARFYFKQLIDGLEYCHNNGIFHMELQDVSLILLLLLLLLLFFSGDTKSF